MGDVNEAPQVPDVHWIATWGDQIKQGDLIKVSKLGGPVRVTSLRRFEQHGSMMGSSRESWYYGAIVTDRSGKEFHVSVQPHEPVFVALEVPLDLPPTGGSEAVAPDGE